jgi:ssDNA-binding Zn-finger/Zn-ribbon topoisomerase 1
VECAGRAQRRRRSCRAAQKALADSRTGKLGAKNRFCGRGGVGCFVVGGLIHRGTRFYPISVELSSVIGLVRQRWHRIRNKEGMANPQLDQFMHALIWKVVPPVILFGGVAILLREFLRWLERKATRAGRSWRAKRCATSSTTNLNTASSAAPCCPSGHGLMVKRTARRGKNAGSNFWGCAEYPRCRSTQAIQRD